MDSVEFAALLADLPAGTADRVVALRRQSHHRTDCPVCRTVADALETALLCARYGENDAARHLVDLSITTAADSSHAHRPPDGPVGVDTTYEPPRRHRGRRRARLSLRPASRRGSMEM